MIPSSRKEGTTEFINKFTTDQMVEIWGRGRRLKETFSVIYKDHCSSLPRYIKAQCFAISLRSVGCLDLADSFSYLKRAHPRLLQEILQEINL
jgi:hypothetical protein